MRFASPELIAHLDMLRTRDAKANLADLYTFTLSSGLVLTYTSADVPVVWAGYTYLADSVLVDGLKFKCSAGLDVDQQQITISARDADIVGGVPFLQALRNGVFDGCKIQRDRAFLSSWTEPPIGTVTLFKGRVGTIDRIGRTTAEVTVNSDLILLDLDMPRNLYAPSCVHVLYDSGCGLVKNAFGVNGTVGVGSSTKTIQWTSASSAYQQGTVTFTSGINFGLTATIKSGTAGELTLAYPLLNAPAPGDTFVAYLGCDHTQTTCQLKFGNLVNFRGFPYVPPPTHAV
jgi:uncharacterized phage protein (TIGR02218 family)